MSMRYCRGATEASIGCNESTAGVADQSVV